jgi:Bifunctional DNA primase/polymerase, N-terminal/Primase C terminal 1 (PriCT-1)
MSDPVVATALAFARHGHAVFPIWWPTERNGRLVCSCRRGADCGRDSAKHPHGPSAPNGLLSASTEPWQIKLWWHRAPLASLGVRTDKLVVVDIDPRHGGDESFAALEREHGEMPPTWRVLTGGGGEHIIFACPDGIEARNVVAEQIPDPPLGKGVDVRGRHGYIVAPPSMHISGRPYAWSVDHHPADVALAPAPDWLITRLTASRAAGAVGAPAGPIEPIPSDVWSQLTRQSITEYRDMAAAKIAGHLFRHSCDSQLIVGLLHAWNSGWCRPPLGPDELNRIIERVAAREAVRIEQQLREGR